jgi:predicted TIM-barrel fold metal-dependent hydrolase
VMFGTSFPILTFEDALQGLEQLEFESETRELLVRGNVKRVYRIPG